MVKALLWWLMSLAAMLLSGFFLFMGIDLFRAAYQLEHPYHFIVTFFASNLIILISAVLIIGIIVRITIRLRHGHPSDNAGQPGPE
jgi:hypothetical protein